MSKGISGYKGVTFRKNLIKNPYESKISYRKGKEVIHIYIGRYKTAELAYIARLEYIDSLK